MTREEIARLGGKAIVEQRGRDYMADLGRKGYEQAVSSHPDFHSKGGEASFAAQNRAAILRGEFPNQSLQMWGYKPETDIPF